jgi:hypothetical protein
VLIDEEVPQLITSPLALMSLSSLSSKHPDFEVRRIGEFMIVFIIVVYM